MKEDKILLPYLLVGALLIVSVALFAYDARTIVSAEETEEDFSSVLLKMGNYLNGLQHVQIHQYEFLLTGDKESLRSYYEEKENSIKLISALRRVITEDFRDSVPKINAVDKVQARYLVELDRAVQSHAEAGLAAASSSKENLKVQLYLQQIQLLLAQMEADIAEVRQATNQNVAFSVKRASISIVVVAVLLITILGVGYRVTSRALAVNRGLAEQLAHDATHDTLTLLPNRRFFNGWLSKSIALAQRNKFSMALYFIDLDGFKQVNDLYGHDAGDEVLRAAARRFQGLTRESDLLARLGGDEFAILVSQAPEHEELSALAQRIVASLAPPISIRSKAVSVGASIGIAIFPRDADCADLLVRAADEAMYQAKTRGKGQYCFFASPPNPPGSA